MIDSKFDFDAFKIKLYEYLKTVEVKDFNDNIINLAWLDDISLKNNKIIIDLKLPTFALKCEEEIAIKTKRLAQDLAADREIELNVHAEVKSSIGNALVKENFYNIKNVILVSSGKGGVGKSTVSTNLACSLASLGCKVGLLDADVYGPSIPMMCGLTDDIEISAIKEKDSDIAFMVPPVAHNMRIMSIGFLVDTKQAMIWRGPMISSAFMQMFTQVAWGDLDYLIVDLPPGTGDIQLTIAQKLAVSGALVVSTPQDIALSDVIRAKSMFDKVNIPILGIVENMSYFICDGCDKKHHIFKPAKGIESSAKDLGINYINDIPLQQSICTQSDSGIPIVLNKEESLAKDAFINLSKEIATKLAIDAKNLMVEESKNNLPKINIISKAKNNRLNVIN